MLFTNAGFNEDWMNHLWYMWHQSLTIRGNHVPSLFLNSAYGIFYPLYAFYGGTTYALGGALSLLLGNAPLDAYVLSYLLGFIAAYAGWYWSARIFGVGRWLAHVPGILFVTSAAYLMIVYALGDWPEFLAVSVMPLMIAAGLSILRAERLHLLPAVVLAGSAVVFFGSHLLTAIWGSTILVIVGTALLACVPEARRRISWSGLLWVACLVIPAALVSAWFLLPTAAYESKTVIAQSYPIFRHLLSSTMYTVAARHLFTLSRAPASGTIVTTSLPILAMAWVLAGIGISLRARRDGTWLRVTLVICVATTSLLIVMTHAGIILALPRLYATLQFGFRLESYILLGICGAVLAALVLNRDDRPIGRVWTWSLIPILVVAVVGAIGQIDAHPSGESRDLALGSYLKPTFHREGQLDYVDDPQHVTGAHLPYVNFPAEAVHDDHVSVLVHAAPGQRVNTNIRGGPDLVDVSGARIVGTNHAANAVLEIDPRPGTSSQRDSRNGDTAAVERVSVTSAHGAPIIVGRLLTGFAVAFLVLEFLVLAVRGRRRQACEEQADEDGISPS
jgi:hypothetical protein